MAGLFQPVCEFFPIEWSEKHYSSFLNEAKPDQKRLISLLKKSRGIYAFYNSELEIIYLGKTNDNLWTEMKQTYNGEKSHYQKYRVKHPNGQYRPTKSGLVRKIQLENFLIQDAATHFSAYSILDEHIGDVEALMIRLMPNDILNHKMEGNNRLTAFDADNITDE